MKDRLVRFLIDHGQLIIFGIIMVFLGWASSNCCKKQVVTELIPYAKNCELPEKPALPEPERLGNCPGATVCFDLENTKILIERDSIMKQWIRETIARCGNGMVLDSGVSDGNSTIDN